jgi:hypothetical protein
MDVEQARLTSTLILLQALISQKSFFLLKSALMKIRPISRSGKFTPVKRGICFLTLVVAILLSVLSMAWVYQKMKLAMGVDIAEVTLIFAMVIFLEMIMAGMVLAYFIDNIIHRQRFIFRAPQPGGWVDALIQVWGFERVAELPESTAISTLDQLFEANGSLATPNKHKQRGRKPTYSYERCKQVVIKWECRDIFRDTHTLIEFLTEEFGTHVDGSPKVSVQSFYDWRKKVIAESKEENAAKNSSGKKN